MSDARGTFQQMLAQGPILLSGAVGTALLRRGVSTPLPLWSTAPLLEAPAAVRRLHQDYVVAGARVVTANTFRTDRVTLGSCGLAPRTRELTSLALQLAREGVEQAGVGVSVLVAGSLAPVEDCYRPDLVPDERVLRIEHGMKVGHLVAAGASLAIVETMNNIGEACIALQACSAGRLPAIVSFVCTTGARLLSGEPIADAAAAVEPLGPLAVLVNCCPPRAATEALASLRTATRLPFGAYANGCGRPHHKQGWAFRWGPWRRRYLAEARAWLDQGASLLGGCCGTDARTIRDLRHLLDSRARPARPAGP